MSDPPGGGVTFAITGGHEGKKMPQVVHHTCSEHVGWEVDVCVCVCVCVCVGWEVDV